MIKTRLVLILLTFILGTVWFFNSKNREVEVIEGSIVLKHIVNFEDLIIKVKGIRLSDVGYERLISVLDKTTSVKDIRIHKAEDITSVFDSIKGVRRVKLFLFNGDNPMMKVEIVITSPKNYDVEHATLVIN